MLSTNRKVRCRWVFAVAFLLMMTCLLVSCQFPLGVPYTEDGNAPNFETPSGTPSETPDYPADQNNRNPSPDVNKNESTAKVDYSGSAGDRAYETLAEAYANVAETVVEISTETVVNGGWLGNYVTGGAGSGVVISTDGYIVTNHHVIAGADTITVRMNNGVSYEAILIGSDEGSDTAVIWIDTDEPLKAAQLGCSSDLIVGEKVFAIGNPLGSLGGTLTDGIISATARQIMVGGAQMTLLQTNAAVNPGNSGGGLFNMAGELIGVVNAKYSQNDVEGLGFAIPVDTVYEVVSQLIEYGYVRGAVDSGLTLYDAANTVVAWRNFNSTRLGVYIIESEYCDELKYGDYLVSIDGVTVTNGSAADTLFSSYSVGDTVTVQAIRMVETTQNGRQVWTEQKISAKLTLREYAPTNTKVRLVQ